MYGVRVLEYVEEMDAAHLPGFSLVVIAHISQFTAKTKMTNFVTCLTNVLKRNIRIVFDEVHLLLLWKEWHDGARHAILLLGSNANITLLSATVPPAMIDELHFALGIFYHYLKLLQDCKHPRRC